MFTNAQLDRLSSLIEARTGLNTYTRHRQLLLSALEQDGISNLDAYTLHLDLLADNHPVWQALLNDLTINETYFMRDQQQMELLREYVLPTIIQRKRHTTRQIRVWSAGCATGEEAYTLAILLHTLLPDIEQWDVRILGTDISTAAIEIARQGRYAAWSFRNTNEGFRHVYFDQRGDHSVIRKEFQRLVRFEQANLVSASIASQDLIVCRNVLLYFTPEQAGIAERQLLQTLSPAGWLLLSPAETLRHVRQHFQIHSYAQTIAFQKQASDAASTLRHVQPTTRLQPDLYQAAVDALHQQQPELAQQLLAQLDGFATPQITTLAASLALNRGDWKSAKQDLDLALGIDPFYPDAHYLMGLWHMQQSDWMAAYTSLRAAIYSYPQFALAHLLKGDLMMKQGQYDRAARAWNIALQFAGALPADEFLSDVADIRAGQLVDLVNYRLQ